VASPLASRTVSPDYVTVAEVAVLLSLHPQTVYDLVRSGELAAIKVGGSYRIPLNVLRNLPRVEPHPEV
jgi:excisionase family DNA binding protein